MKPTYIEAITLSDAWFQCLYNILDPEKARVFLIDRGSYAGDTRLEFDYITVLIKNPQAAPLLPDIPAQYNIPNPVAEDYLQKYGAYLMTANKEPGEDYTYGQRLCAAKYFTNDAVFTSAISIDEVDQIQRIIDIYKTYGHRNNQMVLQIAEPADIMLGDPPCLRHIDTRIQDGKLHFIIYFRSWDLWGGFPANLAGIAMLQYYMASQIGVGCGSFIASSKGLHLYSYAVDLAKIRCMKNECA